MTNSSNFFEVQLMGETEEYNLQELNEASTDYITEATVILRTKSGKTVTLNTNEVQAYFNPTDE